jgi:putative ABC transport system substrate-binding protein
LGPTILGRREFISVLWGAASAPLVARAQVPGKAYRLAILTRAEPVANLHETSSHRNWRTWHQELRRLGYSEGRNLHIERRSAEGDLRRLPELVRHIVQWKPDAIFAPNQDGAEALKAATVKIPVVAVTSDPIRSGLAATLARPGGNVTGFSMDAGAEIFAKRMALLKETAPTTSRLAALLLRQHWETWIGDELREAARRLGITLIGALLEAPVNELAYRRAFATMRQERADSALVSPSPENVVHRRLIAELAAQAGLPMMYSWRDNVEAGGLVAYAVDVPDIFRRAAGYIDRVLKGANPAEMPFQQPSKFELVLNLKTAKALGLTIPQSILARADEVIE